MAVASDGVTAWLLALVTPGRAVLTVFVLSIAAFVYDVVSQPQYPRSLHRVGYGRGPIAWTRNFLTYVFKHHGWTHEGYYKFSKNDLPFILPAGASRPADIVLPRSQTAWLLDQPDHIVSAIEAHNDFLYTEYNFLGHRLAQDDFHSRVIHRQLARHLPGLIPDLAAQVAAVVDKALNCGSAATSSDARAGSPSTPLDGWREINLWDAWMAIVPTVTNFMLVGQPVCHDAAFLSNMVSLADVTVRNTFLLHMVPRVLHPIVGPLLAISNYRLWRRAHATIGPVIERRIRDMAAKDAGDPALADWTPPEDYLTWSVRQAHLEGDNPAELDPITVSRRLLPLEFAAIHTTVITGHSLFLDLLSSPPERDFVSAIAEESRRELAAAGGVWTKAALMRLFRADSAIRESMRLSNFSDTLVERKVIAPAGLSNPVGGWHAPVGSFLTVNLNGLHHDSDLFENPNDYDALRFSRPREQFDQRPLTHTTPPDAHAEDDESLRMKQLSMVTTSDIHLSFGHGRHACPGRFFAAHELKMVLAHILLNYDLEPLSERPMPLWLGVTIVPPLKAKIRIRRKVS